MPLDPSSTSSMWPSWFRWWVAALLALWLYQVSLTWSYRHLLLTCLGASQ